MYCSRPRDAGWCVIHCYKSWFGLFGSRHTNLPVVFSCGNKTGDISEDPTATLDDGQGVGLTSVCKCAHQEAQRSVYGADGHLVVNAVSRQVPQSTQDTLQRRLLGRQEPTYFRVSSEVQNHHIQNRDLQ